MSFYSFMKDPNEVFANNTNFVRSIAFLTEYYDVDAWRIYSGILQVHRISQHESLIPEITREFYDKFWYNIGYAADCVNYTPNQFVGHILTCLYIKHDESDIKSLFERYERNNKKGGDTVDIEEKAAKKGAEMADVLIDVFGPPSSSAAFQSLFKLGTFFAKCEGYQNEERNAYAMSFGQKLIDFGRPSQDNNGSNLLPPAR